MFSLAERHKKSVTEIFNYPAWEINYWQVYYSKEPSSGQRNEYVLTQLLSMFHGANFKDSKTKPKDFAFPDLWKTQEKSTETQLEIINELSHHKGVKIHKKL